MKPNKNKTFQLRMDKGLNDEMEFFREKLDINWSLDIRNFVKEKVAELKRQQLKDKEQ